MQQERRQRSLPYRENGKCSSILIYLVDFQKLNGTRSIQVKRVGVIGMLGYWVQHLFVFVDVHCMHQFVKCEQDKANSG